MPILETKNLSKHFDALVAVDGVDYSVDAGELRSIIGPNGAGKTTFFNMIAGELMPTSGHHLLLRLDTGALRWRRRIGSPRP